MLHLSKLKILQEVITLSIFVPFAIFYMGRPLKLDYLWAALCILGAVFSFSAPSRNHSLPLAKRKTKAAAAAPRKLATR